jgi:hypothetical protein
LSQKPDHVCILFELPAGLWADQVYLVGDFNDWNPSATPFTRDRNGKWYVAVDLPIHTCHAFCYLIDKLWHSEYHADGWTQGVDGRPISIVEATLTKRESDGRWQKILATVHQSQAVDPVAATAEQR